MGHEHYASDLSNAKANYSNLHKVNTNSLTLVFGSAGRQPCVFVKPDIGLKFMQMDIKFHVRTFVDGVTLFTQQKQISNGADLKVCLLKADVFLNLTR